MFGFVGYIVQSNGVHWPWNIESSGLSFGDLSAKATPEKKERGLLAEINNGRLAMLGIMAFTAEQKIPGSVPALGQLGLKPYSGEFMAPFSASNADLPYVSEMLGFTSLW